MKNCERCNKELEDEKGNSHAGMVVCVRNISLSNDTEFLQKQMGKYEVGKDYNFCFECLLDTLMGVAS